MDERIGILGGGISGLACAYFCGKPVVVFEKEAQPGGLCRSFSTRGVTWDIGPHIYFSRNDESLNFLRTLTPMEQRRRSNKIFYAGRQIKYPLENDLASLPPAERDWCLHSFLRNPYRPYRPYSLLSFFYQNFGEGMTRLYFEPYNRKIWKYEPSFMDLQMVDRIPRPPEEDVIASAQGVPTEGYKHQLNFYYPRTGGSASIIKGLLDGCGQRLQLKTNAAVEKVTCRADGSFEVQAGGRCHGFQRLVSAMPLHQLVPRLDPPPPDDILRLLDELLYNSLHLSIVQVSAETMGDNYAFMLPDPAISFHRLSKVDFLGESYRLPGGRTLMAEITYRPGDRFDLPDGDISELVSRDLVRSGIVPSARDIMNIETRSFPFAYVIYDLYHRQNTDKMLSWLSSRGIISVGRFATFEYINVDTAIERSRLCAALSAP